MPFCSSLEGRPNPEVPITNSNNIVDISGVGLKQFWNLKDHMQESSVLATQHYPETLDRIFVSRITLMTNHARLTSDLLQVIGAPSFFPTVWSWIKRWFDPVTVNKIFILSHHEVKSRLSEFIDPDDFPKKYGGNLDWDVGMSPHLDEAARQAVERNGSQGWIEGPCLWEQGQRVPTGTIGGKPRRTMKVEEPTGSAQAPVTDLIPPQSEVTASSNPPSMAHSGSTASTFINNPQDTTTGPLAANGISAKVLDSEAPLVANGEVLHASGIKPAMERFVTAAEDLHTSRAQIDSVA